MTHQKNTAQETFLKTMMDNKKYVNIFLKNGFRITGRICDFDKFTINIPDKEGRDQLIYKNAISTISLYQQPVTGKSDSYSSIKDIGFIIKKKT